MLWLVTTLILIDASQYHDDKSNDILMIKDFDKQNMDMSIIKCKLKYQNKDNLHNICG